MPRTRHAFVRRLRISVRQTESYSSISFTFKCTINNQKVNRVFPFDCNFCHQIQWIHQQLIVEKSNNTLNNTGWQWFTVHHFKMKILILSAFRIAHTRFSHNNSVNSLLYFTFEQPYPSSAPAEVFPFKSLGSSQTINSSGLKNLKKVLRGSRILFQTN